MKKYSFITSLMLVLVVGLIQYTLVNPKTVDAEELCPATRPTSHSTIRTGGPSGTVIGDYDNQGWNMESGGGGPTNVTLNVAAGTVLYFTNTTSGGTGPNRSLGGVQAYSAGATVDPPSYRAGYYASGYYFTNTVYATGHTDPIISNQTMQVGYYQSCWGGFDDGITEINITINVTGPPVLLTGSGITSLTIFDTPDVSLQVNGSSSATIAAGSSATLSWTPVNTNSGTSCTGTGSWGGAKSSTPGSTYTESTGSLSAGTYTYNISCIGALGSVTSTKTVSLTVTPNAPTAAITANGTAGSVTVSYNTAATIAWTSSNATSCSISPSGWTGTSGSRSSGNLTATTTYVETCNGPGGTATSSVTVNVLPAPDFSANCSPATSTITQGATTSFSLSTIPSNGFASGVTFSANFSPNTGTLPTVSFSNNGAIPSATTSAIISTNGSTTAGAYTITFSGTGGGVTHTCTTNVIVNASAPTVSITANGTAGSVTVSYNTAATIAWTSSNATSCSISPSGWTGTSGSQSSGNLTATTTYMVTCNGPGGNATANVVVNVLPAPNFAVSCLPITSTVSQGSNTAYTLSTSGSNGFASGVTFSASFSPNTGTLPTVSFSNNGATPDATTVALISTTGATTSGNYTMTFSGTGGGITKTCNVNLTVNVTNPPPPPTNLTAINTVTCGAVTVTWQPDGAHDTSIQYEVYKATSGSGPWTLMTTVPYQNGLATYSQTDNTPSSGSNYYYVTASKNGIVSAQAFTSPVSPQVCAVNIDFSNKDLFRVNNNTASAGAGVNNSCNGQSDVFTLPNQALFKEGDKVYFRINVCNNCNQTLTGITVNESASLSGLTNIAYDASFTSPAGCVVSANDVAKTYSLADIAPAVNGTPSVCSFVLTANVSSGGGPAGQLYRFQNIATINSSQASKTISTPRYLFGVGSGVPTRNETSP